jgi:hypothetical protein
LQWSDTQFVTIGNLQKLNKEEFDYILNFLMDEIQDRGEYYLEQSIISIVFSYGIRDGRALEKIIQTKVQYHNYQHHKFPITMDPLQYGKLIRKFENNYIIQINDKNTAVISQFKDHNEIEFYRSGELTYKFIDKWLDESSFIRTIGRKEFIFNINSEQLLFKMEKPVRFIHPLVRPDTLVNKFLTMDIETFIKNGVHIPYVISFYDGENTFSYYLTDFKDSLDMIKKALSDIMVKKYDNYKVYIHNLANFDGIFLLKILTELGVCKPLIHNDRIISIGFNMNGYVIQFRDSQQLLLASLLKLGKAFKVKTLKAVFPHTFVNEDTLNYIGINPSISLFKGITDEEYEGVMSYSWNLRYEVIRYCEIDCISLYQIISKFNDLIFKLFKISIHKYPTISSLAFAIFRSNFLTSNTIPQISGQVAKDIRKSFTGGACDMYIPSIKGNNKIYAYDVNSLYPFIMKNYDMPIGKPTLFEGNIRAIDPNAFGFFFCNIIAPEGLNEPILQTHVKTSGGLRTIAPLGQWSDMIFSAEMDNAIRLGYKFEILWGYTFDKGNIFKDFVENLYNLRLQYPKTDPLNYLAKIILNSVFGKFAMLEDMPTGEMLFSTDSNINNYFGIVFVEVDTSGLDPKYSKYPLLPHKIDGRMYNPLGSWSGWYFSEEVKLAISYGYSIKVLYGYKFDKTSNVFSSFINKFFAVKAGLSNINMDRTTAKLILNSMFGRLGMKPYQDNVEIVDSSKALDILSKFNVKEQYNLTDTLEFIRYENEPITGFLELYGKDEYLNFILDLDAKNISVNQSLPSAIAITAYARMYMFKVIYRLLDLGIEIYYMDTDSIVVNIRIPEDLIGNKLGLFKLEHEIEQGYFISPKLYAFKTVDGKYIVKAKGIGNKIEFNQFETLIKNDSIVKAQERWFKDPSNATINIKNIDMQISSINLKRRQFMDNNRLSFTAPLYIKNQIILKNK